MEVDEKYLNYPSKNMAYYGACYSQPLTFRSCWSVFVCWFLVLLLTPQIARVNRHGGFNLLLSQFHAVIKDSKESF